MAVPAFNFTISTISFYILLAVADRPLHGYAIRDQIAYDSDSELLVATGTLYPALTRLVKAGLIETIDPPDTTTTIKCRYRITTKGKQQLAAEARRLGRVALHARHKLGDAIIRA